MTEIMKENRPDVVFFENVTEIDKENADDESNLSILEEAWKEIRYESQVIRTDTVKFGIPQHRRRIVIVALNTRDPQLFTFSTRNVATVFTTLRALLMVCHRKPECATKYLFPYDDVGVTTELARAKKEAEARQGRGARGGL